MVLRHEREGKITFESLLREEDTNSTLLDIKAKFHESQKLDLVSFVSEHMRILRSVRVTLRNNLKILRSRITSTLVSILEVIDKTIGACESEINSH